MELHCGFCAASFSLRASGRIFFITFLAAFLFFFLWKFFFWANEYARAHADGDRAAKQLTKKKAKELFRRAAMLGVRIFVPMLFVGVVLSVMVAHIAPSRIEASDGLFMQFDRALFGTYPVFWFQNVGNPLKEIFDAGTPLFAAAYGSIEVVLGGLLLLLFLVDERRLRIFVLSILLNLFIALPMWYLLPAIGPNDAFMKEGHEFPKPPDVDIASRAYAPNPFLAQAITELRYPVGIAITAFPSMHVAWGTSAALVASHLHPAIGTAVWAWWAVNNISTVYLLQHYAVDVLAGWALAIFSYFLAQWIVARSELPASSSRVERLVDVA